MADLRQHSSTSNMFRVTLKNSSTGAPLTGLSSASSGLIISTIADNEASATAYTVAGSTIESISTLGTFAAPTATKCRFKEVDATNHPGLYELQIADARFSVASAKRLIISISGATNLLAIDYEVQLTQMNVYDAVRGGMTALPNAAAAAAGGLIILGSNNTAAITIGALTVGAIAGTTLTLSGAVAFQSTFAITGTTTFTGAISGTSASNDLRINGAVPGAAGGIVIAGSNAATTFATLTSTGAFTINGVSNVSQTGDTYALANGSSGFAAIYGKVDTEISSIITTLGTPAGASLAADLVTIAGYIDTEVGAIVSTLGTPAGVSLAADIAAVKSDSAAILVDTGTTLDGKIDAIDDYLDTEIAAIKTKTDFLPSATAGSAGGVTIAGSNAATTFATLTSTGAFSINGTSNVAQTGDSFARLGAPAGASHAADVAAVKVDTAAIKTKTDSLTFTVAGKVDSNTLAINGSTTAAAAQAKGAKAIATAVVGVGSTTTSIVLASISTAGGALTVGDADQLKGRPFYFDDDTTTTQLRGQGTDITANTTGATPTLTVTALTRAPANGDTITIF